MTLPDARLSFVFPMWNEEAMIRRTVAAACEAGERLVGDGKVAGFSLHRTVAAEAELLLLAVAPERRRRGFGRGLLDHFIADARAAGAEKVHLEVRENNAALAMYKAAGFRLVGRRRDYYCGKDGSRFDALTFAKDVTA